jgi:hypothetical protein
VSYWDDPSFKFASALRSYGSALEELQYESAFKPPPARVLELLLPKGSIALSRVQSMLKGDAVAPPHGVELLKPFPIPKFSRSSCKSLSPSTTSTPFVLGPADGQKAGTSSQIANRQY